MTARLFGFTLLRNAVKYDYCFEESLESLLNVCEDVTIAFDPADDDTGERLKKISKLNLIHSPWNMQKREGGIVLSEQTNISLEALRKNQSSNPDAWGFYLQADEVLHEDDRDLILHDVNLANDMGYDAIAFRYLHFWQSHHSIAINKKWYPQEIRAIKLNTNIESWGDAQSFRNYKKIFYSEARIFHYGHVREEDKYLSKKADILKMYHSDQKLAKYKRREKRFDSQTETLSYWGPQPKWMKERMIRLGEEWSKPQKDEVYILGDSEFFHQTTKSKIYAMNTFWVTNLSEVPSEKRAEAIITMPTLWQRIRYPSTVPLKMRSPLARPWTMDFILTLKLSEKDISVS